MAAKYKYNPATCQYEPYYLRGKALWKQIGTFLFIATVLAVTGYYFTVKHFDSVSEMILQEKNEGLKVDWQITHQRIIQAQKKLAALVEKDDHNYRVILDTNPLPASMREAGTGGSAKFDMNLVRDYDYLVSDFTAMQKLTHQAQVELQSYAELEKMLDNQLRAWAARPAIQPISNEDLKVLYLSFGLREHPLFKVWREHKGLDFAADMGTPVYATGDGKITKVYFSGSFGNVVFIDHGYGYESRYAHLSRFAVSEGDVVRRGEVVGYVGTTGHSAGPHLHYEILFNNEHINPINFFQRDLSNEEYQKLIELGSENTISLD